MIISAVSGWLKDLFGWESVADQIVFDRENKQMSYVELSVKYKKPKEEIKKIWYRSLGLSYLGTGVSIKDLPAWIDGLGVRPAMALIEAGFKNKFQIRTYMAGNPKILIKIDNIGKKSITAICHWLNKE